jgi:hypothetical protein
LGKFFKLTDCVIFCCIISIYLIHIHFSQSFSLFVIFFFSLQIHFHYNPQVTIIFNYQFFFISFVCMVALFYGLYLSHVWIRIIVLFVLWFKLFLFYSYFFMVV